MPQAARAKASPSLETSLTYQPTTEGGWHPSPILPCPLDFSPPAGCLSPSSTRRPSSGAFTTGGGAFMHLANSRRPEKLRFLEHFRRRSRQSGKTRFSIPEIAANLTSERSVARCGPKRKPKALAGRVVAWPFSLTCMAAVPKIAREVTRPRLPRAKCTTATTGLARRRAFAFKEANHGLEQSDRVWTTGERGV